MNNPDHFTASHALGDAGQQLLLACARTRISDGHLQKIRQLAPGADWQGLLQSARRHNLVPLLYRSLGMARAPGVPAAVLSEMRAGVMHSASKGLRLAGELTKLIRDFEAADLRVLPFKGAALAAVAYGGVALRPFNDIDLIVHPADAPRAAALLAGHGFPDWGVPPGAEAAQLAGECEHAFDRADGVCVDLHWRMSRRHFPFPLPFDDLWRRSRPCSLRRGAAPVASLCPADALQVLCMHGTKHAWDRLAWVCDVAELLAATPDLSWDFVLSQAATLGATRMLLLGLALAEGLLEAPLPPEVRGRLKADGGIAPLVHQVRRQIFRTPPNSTGLGEVVRHSLFHLRVRNRTRDRLRYCLMAAAPTTRDLRSTSLPTPLYFLNYLTRPVRLLGKHLPGMSQA